MDQCHIGCNIDAACIEVCADAFEPKVVRIESVLGALGLLCLSGLFSGLTLGLMSLDLRQLQLTITGGDEASKKAAEKILPLRKRGNLLLCTLLLGNTLVNAGIAILTASFTGGFIGGLLSTGFILIFGEIIPQSVCSRYGLAAGAKTVDLVYIIRVFLMPVAWPLSKILDRVLGEELGTIYSRKELMELFAMQAKNNVLEANERDGADNGSTNRQNELDEGIGQHEVTFMCGVLSLSERKADQIMTKMGDVFAIFTDERLDFPLMSRIYKSGFTRIPVLRRTNLPAGAGGASALGEKGPTNSLCPKRSHSEGTSSGHGGHGACADLSTELSADSPTVVGELCELSSNAQQNSLRRREASSNSLLEDERRILEHARSYR